MGGLSKKAFLLEQLRRRAESPSLTLDAGALLFKNKQLAATANQEKMTAVGIVKSYNLMGYDAVGVSSRDLAGGLEFLRQLEKISQFSWLSANLVQRSTQAPIFKSSLILPVGALKVGIIGLTNPIPAQPLLAQADAVILPWHDALKAEVSKLAGKTDFLILLSNLDELANQTIGKEFAIHLILPADVVPGNFPPRQSNNTLLSQSGPQGKHLGVLTIDWQPSQRWGLDLNAELAKKQGALAQTVAQLQSYRQEHGLLASPAEPTADPAPYRQLQASESQLRYELQALQQQLLAAGTTPPPATYSNEFVAIQASMADQPEVARLLRQLHEEENRHAKMPATPQGETPYLGSQGCATCHPRQMAAWQKSRHAHAYQTLVARQQENNLNCLHCHLTGISSEFEPAALTLPEERRNVGCENCHGPGRRHATDPQRNRLQPQPTQEVCQACHTADHDDSFDFPRKRALLGCPP